ncbi:MULTISPECIES: hypothetical protein [unclassified Frankia]|uniref:hypothetical protein n=1 Tax=unclassified Frankia TaxID=2632575 RepID=UPI001EF467E3|nr:MULTISPECIES: hypothetical protein [unclassified Frankia]
MPERRYDPPSQTGPTSQTEPNPSRIRRTVEDWMTRHAPATAARLASDPHGPQALDDAAATICRKLNRAEVLRTDPTTVEPDDDEEFYVEDEILLAVPAEKLERVLVRMLASDEDYWSMQLRLLPMMYPADPATPEPFPRPAQPRRDR